MTILRKLAIAYNRQACSLAKPSKHIDEDVFDNTYKRKYSVVSGRSGKVFKRLMRRK